MTVKQTTASITTTTTSRSGDGTNTLVTTAKDDSSLAVEHNNNPPPPPAAAAAPTTPVAVDAPQSMTMNARMESNDNECNITNDEQLWMDSPFAIGRTPLTWDEEAVDCACCRQAPRSQMWFTACCCSKLGAGRVGNMVVLWQTKATRATNKDSTNSSAESTTSTPAPTLRLVVGPYWTVPACVTFPLIALASVATFFRADLANANVALLSVWAASTACLALSLCKVATTNPGIMVRHTTAPPTTNDNDDSDHDWIWNDQAYTFRPKHARFDADVQAVVEHFDHTCPWTGTAIGGGNMFWFKSFLVFLFVTLFVDIIFIMVV